MKRLRSLVSLSGRGWWGNGGQQARGTLSPGLGGLGCGVIVGGWQQEVVDVIQMRVVEGELLMQRLSWEMSGVPREGREKS